jgi:hypothetical protein
MKKFKIPRKRIAWEVFKKDDAGGEEHVGNTEAVSIQQAVSFVWHRQIRPNFNGEKAKEIRTKMFARPVSDGPEKRFEITCVKRNENEKQIGLPLAITPEEPKTRTRKMPTSRKRSRRQIILPLPRVRQRQKSGYV